MEKSKILVIGGEGFIGFNLCKELSLMDYIVTSFDSNLTKQKNRRIDGVTYVRGDTNNINIILKDYSFDCIVHLGEYSRVENSYDNIHLIKDSNIKGTSEVLEFWRKQRCKLIYAGSSTKFSNINEETPYIYTKRNNTELVKKYSQWFNLKYAITYFYNVYGESENEIGDFSTLIGIFKNKIKNKEPLTVVLPGYQRRNFTHIDDTISGIILVIKNGEGDEFGIGANEDYSIMEVATMFSKKFNSKVTYLPERKGNRGSSPLLNNKIIKLGWKQKNNLKDYINNLKI